MAEAMDVIPFEDMDDEKQQKWAFVDQVVGPAVKHGTDGWAARVRYETDGCDERVVIVDRFGRSFAANVTADSLWAIVKDVVWAVDRKFGE